MSLVQRLCIQIAGLALLASALSCSGQEILWINEPGSNHYVQRYNLATRQVSVFARSIGSKARAIAYNPKDDRVYIASEGKIQRYNRAGEVVDTFATSANITSPMDMTFDGAGNLFLANQEPGRVFKYTAGGVESEHNPSDRVPIGYATGVAFGPDGKLYVSAMQGWYVLRDTGAGGWQTIVPTQAGIPERIAWGPDGKLYATIFGEKPAKDRGILRYKSDGTPDGQFAELTYAAGLVWTPGPDARLFAGDHGTNKVWQFTSNGAPTLVTADCSAPGAMIYLPAGK